MGYLILESGHIFSGQFLGGQPKAGEVVFNTSHSGYEEMATDPSYYSQILVTTSSQQGNYGVDKSFWESQRMWINGFVCLEMQRSSRDSAWLDQLTKGQIPVLTEVDTRSLAITLRSLGTVWGAIVNIADLETAKNEAKRLIEIAKRQPADWTALVSRKQVEDRRGQSAQGPRVALIDFGCKENIIRELCLRAKEVRVFPASVSADTILAWNPDGICLSNGPGDPAAVLNGIQTVRQLLGRKYIFGICMGHQVLSLALGAKTYKLKFGHRGSNHPIQDRLLNRVYVASQNHGYNVDPTTLPKGVSVSHMNLNDQTAAGIHCPEQKCMSVQFHPESHPGPHDSAQLFDYFMEQIK